MPDINSKIETGSGSPRKFSRRDFLKLSGATVAALALRPLLDASADIWQPKVVDLGIEILKNPVAIELILTSSAKTLETVALQDHRALGAPKITTNPLYRSITELIQEVLKKRSDEGKAVTYQRLTGYEKLPYYIDRLHGAINDPANRDRSAIEAGELPAVSYILGYSPRTLGNIIFYYNNNVLPQHVRVFKNESDGEINLTSDFFMDGRSGFFDRIIDILGEDSRILLSKSEEDSKKYYDYLYGYKDYIDGQIRKYLQDIRQHTEEFVSRIGTPVSAGEVFSYCLDRNKGSIDKSLTDTTLFLKYMARNDISLATFDRVEPDSGKLTDSEEWFQKNIKDEYGRVGCYTKLTAETYPYNGQLTTLPGAASLEVDKDLHLRNQIGKPYHAWNIATLLSALPPPIVQMGVAYRQYITFDSQGPVKTAADFRVALELEELDSLFMTYS